MYYISLIAYLVYQVSASQQVSMFNKDLVVAAQPWPPVLVVDRHENGTETYSGILWVLMEYIKEARNCTYKVIRSPDGQWGYCYGLNNCTGMLGQVNSNEVDFAIGLQLSM